MPERDDLDFHLETAGGVPYRLQPGYPTIDCDEDKVTATEVYIIPADRIGDFYFESMPGVKLSASGELLISSGRALPGTNFITTKRVAFKPWQGDFYPADPFEVDRAELGNDLWAKTYSQYYEATIEYETSQLDDQDQNEPGSADPEEFLEHSVSVNGQLIAGPPKNVKVADKPLQDNPTFIVWEPNAPAPPSFTQPILGIAGDQKVEIAAADMHENKDPQLPVTKFLPGLEHNFKWKFVLNPDWNAIRATLGHLNDRPDPLFFNTPPETVMFTGLSGSQQFLWTGRIIRPGVSTPGQVRVKPWSIDFKFSERYVLEGTRAYGWNHVYSPTNGWIKPLRQIGVLRAAAVRVPIYPCANLRNVFRTVAVISNT